MNQDSAPDGGLALLEREEVTAAPEHPWRCRLHNDPINLITYVTRTLSRVLKCSKDKAEVYALTAHTEGSAVVKQGSVDECRAVAEALQFASLWATIEKGK